ncbi:hypothetical protein GCM10009819_37230 [Agromyces tropicus]|uniref:Regulator of SigK n=1 Tax=Agromyces tropicus TaxID=555371 RepID=A0ABN2UZX2_9MICO
MTEPGTAGDPVPEDLDTLLAAYALDAVADDERAVVEARLAASEAARERLREHREAAAALAASAEPVTPSSSLRASIMDRLDDHPQVPADRRRVAPSTTPESMLPAPAEPLAPVSPPAPATSAGAASPPGAGPVERAARRRWFQRPGAIVAAAAAAVLLVAGAIFGVNWPGPAGWGAQRDVQAIASAPDAQTSTTASAAGGEVTLVWSEELGRSAVRTADLPDPGSGSTYELWYIDETGAEPAGTFDPAGGAAYVVLDGAFRPGVIVGITVEPAGGSPAPTTDPVAVFET